MNLENICETSKQHMDLIVSVKVLTYLKYDNVNKVRLEYGCVYQLDTNDMFLIRLWYSKVFMWLFALL